MIARTPDRDSHPAVPTMPDPLTFSATDLSNFLGCRHLALLDRRVKLGGPRPPRYPDPALEALQQRARRFVDAHDA